MVGELATQARRTSVAARGGVCAYPEKLQFTTPNKKENPSGLSFFIYALLITLY